MAKTNKLNKLTCILKRWHSSSRLSSSSSSCSSSASVSFSSSASFNADEVPAGLLPVYVGKSRRRYLISKDLADNPLFLNLLDRSGDGEATVVGCEVVLFEHLLWMLENADPKADSLAELVEFYAC